MRVKLGLIGLVLAIGIVASSVAYSGSGGSPVDLTGTWRGNDGGTYYIRQIGTQIWWFGELAPTSPAWSNVAHGEIQGNSLVLDWADVPKGRIMSSGSLRLVVQSANSLTATERTGGFGGSAWTRQ